MGVDFSGNYGIGVELVRKEFEEDSDYYGDFIYYLEDILEGTTYFYFEVGRSNYTGGEDNVFICICDPFEDGYCGLEEKVSALYSFLAKNEIEYIGKVDVVGGLRIH